jgi:RNA polymerase II elongation factor ELL
VIHIPGHGAGKKFNFALSQLENPARTSLECIRQSKNKRTMQSLGKIRYKLKVQATDEIYETTRAKMAAANTAAKLNATKVIKESGPKVGRKITKPSAGTSSGYKNSAGGFAARTQNHNPVISVTAPAEKSCPPVSSSKKGTRIAHSSALLSVPSPQAYPVSNGSQTQHQQHHQRSVSSQKQVNGNSSSSHNNNNKYSSEKKSELKSAASPSPATNGYSDLISHWANKPTSPSAPEPAQSHKSSHSDAGSSCGSLTGAPSPLSADERQRLRSEFNAQYSEYKALYSTLQEASQMFCRLEEKMKSCAEGSEEWNVSSDVMLSHVSFSFSLIAENSGNDPEEVRGA